MLDRHLAVSDVPGQGVSSCAYCTEGDDTPAAAKWPPDRLAHLYLCHGLSTYRIAQLTGNDRQRVTRQLQHAGVVLRPRGAGRLRPLRRQDSPGLAELVIDLYRAGKLSSRQIAVITGLPERTVRDRLRRYGVPARTRGRWNREDRRAIPAAALRSLYEQLGLTAAEVGALVGASSNIVLRSAHDLGMPVRTGGRILASGPEEIELIEALYDDGPVASVLALHEIQRVPPGAPIWARFPAPVPLSTPLVKDLYWSCGIGLHHIELLTGQPAETVRGFMQREGIPLRHPGGRTPFRRRWQASGQSAATTKEEMHNDGI